MKKILKELKKIIDTGILPNGDHIDVASKIYIRELYSKISSYWVLGYELPDTCDNTLRINMTELDTIIRVLDRAIKSTDELSVLNTLLRHKIKIIDKIYAAG